MNFSENKAAGWLRLIAAAVLTVAAMILLSAAGILMPAAAEITVGTGKDYSSFTEAVYATVDSGENITVYPGEYDIRAEFEALFGEAVPERFKHGIFLHDREVLFLPGSRLVCVWDRDDNFSPLYSGGNVTLDGMDLYAQGTLYAVHDDLWHWEAPYVNVYRRCRIIGRLLKNANIIGGGVARNARIVIENCWFDNGVEGSITVRYHNTDVPEAVGDIWISNTYFNGYLAMCYFGTAAHLTVYVNGCRAEAVIRRKETPYSWMQNIDLYQWNNETGK